MKTGIYSLMALILLGVSSNGFSQIKGERALFLSGNQTLMGCIYRPKGTGPFPAVVFNQNTNKRLNQSGPIDPFPALAKIFVSKGYVLFVPGRHTSGNTGDDESAADKNETDLKLMQNHEAHARNLFAAVTWIKAQHDVDNTRVAVIGDASGAISTLFAVRQGLDVRGLVLFSPGAKKLKTSPAFQSRLKQAVRETSSPVFLIQPENDFNLLPKTMLGPVIAKKGSPSDVKIYAAFGGNATEAHRFAVEGSGVWQRDVIAFLSTVMN